MSTNKHRNIFAKYLYLIALCLAFLYGILLLSNSSKAEEILFLVGNADALTNADPDLVTLLEDLGHNVTPMSSNALGMQEQIDAALDADLVLISETLGSSTTVFNGVFSLKDVPVPVVSFEAFMWDDAGWTGTTIHADFGNTGRPGDLTAANGTDSLASLQSSIFIVAPQHAMAAGLSGEVEVYTEAYSVNFGLPGPEADVIAMADAANTFATLFIYDEGDFLLDGSLAPAARVGLFLGQNAAPDADYGPQFDFLTEEGILLIEGAVDFALNPIAKDPFVIDGSGQTYLQDFDSMGTTLRTPEGWIGSDENRTGRRISSLGLVDGPLDGASVSVAGTVNVGGSADRFSTPTDGRLGTWKDDLDGSGVFDEGDVIVDGASDRALGSARVNPDDTGSLTFEIEIASRPLRAFVAEWDLEVWGGDPEAAFRGTQGAGYSTELKVGGTSYYGETVSLKPGDLFDSAFDLAPGATHDPTLINGNEHAVRGISSGIIEVSAVDGAVGNLVQWTFDGDHGGADEGWIQAVDNVLLRALAAGDAQADGDVDPADLIQLLAGGAFGQGNIDATWGQGDFDNDGDFDGTDILAVVQGLAGEFPKTYSHDPGNGVPDVLINPATGNITLDTNGTTIGSIVMDSAAGIFNGPNSPMWDAPGDFAADIDTQISMPISFTNPGYTGVDDLGDGIIGDLSLSLDILADLTIKYLDPNGDLLDAEAHVVPEPSSMVLALLALIGLFGYCCQRRRQN